jgi:hypothetical protein
MKIASPRPRIGRAAPRCCISSPTAFTYRLLQMVASAAAAICPGRSHGGRGTYEGISRPAADTVCSKRCRRSFGAVAPGYEHQVNTHHAHVGARTALGAMHSRGRDENRKSPPANWSRSPALLHLAPTTLPMSPVLRRATCLTSRRFTVGANSVSHLPARAPAVIGNVVSLHQPLKPQLAARSICTGCGCCASRLLPTLCAATP